MKIGFSLSPGGLLLPYHLGALASLSHHGYLTDSTPLAGSSAGAIAVASHASGVAALKALEAATRVSRKSHPLFVARGGLLPALRTELDHLLPAEAHKVLTDREGLVALAHRELFPRNRSVLQTQFETRRSLMDAICDSSMFPYFLTNRPVRMVRRQGRMLPRMVVDGVFACSAERIGCPDFGDCVETHHDRSTRIQHTNLRTKNSHERRTRGPSSPPDTAPPDTSTRTKIDRTIMVSVFPTEMLSLTTSHKQDQIGPAVEENMAGQAARLVRMATLASSAADLQDLYQQGFLDAEHWVVEEDRRNRMEFKVQLKDKRRRDLFEQQEGLLAP